jgi:hypothetical protein
MSGVVQKIRACGHSVDNASAVYAVNGCMDVGESWRVSRASQSEIEWALLEVGRVEMSGEASNDPSEVEVIGNAMSCGRPKQPRLATLHTPQSTLHNCWPFQSILPLSVPPFSDAPVCHVEVKGKSWGCSKMRETVWPISQFGTLWTCAKRRINCPAVSASHMHTTTYTTNWLTATG